jgi:hypothetical protein
MPNCEICDQELVEGDFEEKIGICVNCIYYFLIPPLIVCVVSGSVVIYISFFLKFN